MIDFRGQINSVKFTDLRFEYNGDTGVDSNNCWIKNPGQNLVVENCGFAPQSSVGEPLFCLVRYDVSTSLGGTTTSLIPGTLFKNCNFFDICAGTEMFALGTSTVAVTGRISFEDCTFSGPSTYGSVATVPNVTAGSTTITAGSNGQVLPQATINVASTSNFLSSGSLLLTTSDGIQVVTYTGKTLTTFTGCSGGSGTMSTGGSVKQLYCDATFSNCKIASFSSSLVQVPNNYSGSVTAIGGVIDTSAGGSANIELIGSEVVDGVNRSLNLFTKGGTGDKTVNIASGPFVTGTKTINIGNDTDGGSSGNVVINIATTNGGMSGNSVNIGTDASDLLWIKSGIDVNLPLPPSVGATVGVTYGPQAGAPNYVPVSNIRTISSLVPSPPAGFTPPRKVNGGRSTYIETIAGGSTLYIPVALVRHSANEPSHGAGMAFISGCVCDTPSAVLGISFGFVLNYAWRVKSDGTFESNVVKTANQEIFVTRVVNADLDYAVVGSTGLVTIELTLPMGAGSAWQVVDLALLQATVDSTYMSSENT
jgi:hypothetical protein